MTKAKLEIEIDVDVWDTLKSVAEPFVDTPNMVLRRLLGIEKSDPDKKQVKSKKKMTPQRDYRPYLIKALKALGGSAKLSDTTDLVGELMQDKLVEKDFEVLASTGEIRWRNMVAWERYEMVCDGLLKGDSPRGTWELSKKGYEFSQSMDD